MKQIVYILVVGIIFFSSIQAQENRANNENFELVDFILPMVVSQPDSPLKVEYATVGKLLDEAQYSVFYQVRNIGSKPIAHYTIARWYSDNTGTYSGGVLPKSNLLLPNEIYGNLPESIISNFQKHVEKVNQTNENNVKKQFKRFAFVMIVDITFSDGSKYNAIDTFNAFSTHLRLFETQYIDDKDDDLRILNPELAQQEGTPDEPIQDHR